MIFAALTIQTKRAYATEYRRRLDLNLTTKSDSARRSRIILICEADLMNMHYLIFVDTYH